MSEAYLCVRMTGTDASLREYLTRHPNEPQAIERAGDQISLRLLILERELPEAQKFGSVKVLFNATEIGTARQSQVSRVNRYANGQIPLGVGLKH